MITNMRVNPDHPAPQQTFTTFPIPGGLLDTTLFLITAAIVLNTAWEAATETGTFAHTPGLIRGAVVAGIIYLAIWCSKTALNHRRGSGGIGPAIERIEP